MKNLKSILFNGVTPKAKEDADDEIKNIEEKYSEYIKNNNLNDKSYYLLSYNSQFWSFKITDKDVAQSDFGKELESSVLSVLRRYSK